MKKKVVVRKQQLPHWQWPLFLTWNITRILLQAPCRKEVRVRLSFPQQDIPHLVAMSRCATVSSTILDRSQGSPISNEKVKNIFFNYWPSHEQNVLHGTRAHIYPQIFGWYVPFLYLFFWELRSWFAFWCNFYELEHSPEMKSVFSYIDEVTFLLLKNGSQFPSCFNLGHKTLRRNRPKGWSYCCS